MKQICEFLISDLILTLTHFVPFNLLSKIRMRNNLNILSYTEHKYKLTNYKGHRKRIKALRYNSCLFAFSNVLFQQYWKHACMIGLFFFHGQLHFRLGIACCMSWSINPHNYPIYLSLYHNQYHKFIMFDYLYL